MRLDVLVPTWNRAPLLERTLRSLMSADIPPDLHVSVTVIDNNCTDGTAELVQYFAAAYPGRITTVTLMRPGKSRALNDGITATSADLVGMIDDDEEIDRRWYHVVAQAFRDEAVDFVGGPYIPRWDTAPPEWMPPDYRAVVGAVDSGTEPLRYGADFPGILKGGNAVIRRRILEQVGPYAEWLGPAADARLLSCEDEEMYQRLLKFGARGYYLPALVVYHHVATERLTRSYHRRWCFWRGASRGMTDHVHPMPVRYLAGVPRFLFGRAARGLTRLAQCVAAGRWSRMSFGDELAMWDLAGYLYGKHFCNVPESPRPDPLLAPNPTRDGRYCGTAVT
jgi:glucosyl-dolichyl phosphate glucuronosyltransferase